MSAVRLLVIASLTLFVGSADLLGQDSAAAPSWSEVQIPDAWKKLPHYAPNTGTLWFRCFVELPESWSGRELHLFVEGVDDARQFYFNRTLIGEMGAFPPQYRSGLGTTSRLAIDPGIIRQAGLNQIAIRVYRSDGRGGFNVAAPILVGGDQAIRLSGSWQALSGDNLLWAALPPDQVEAKFVFDKLESAGDVDKTFKRLGSDDRPLAPAEAFERLSVLDDLVVDPVLEEPVVAQPLSMKFDERGRLWVMQYRQYPNPAGLTMVSRDQYLRTVYDRIPAAPPHHFRGRDRITIHEDTDGDGRLDLHKVFVDGLSLATSMARGRGGVWVLNPPYLLFYRDEDRDDVPDGDPEVHLEGFGLEDSHSIANSLRWGPDGWLYAAQGSTVTGAIRRPGTDDKPVHSMGQLIWRYHPESRRYEIFAEGGGNAFGVEIDAKGRIYSGHNGGDTRGFHYIQGGYFQKGFGKHGALSNPYTFGYFPWMKHHQVPRFTHTFVIYEGGALPASYQGVLFGVAPLQSHVVFSQVDPDGSTFQTRDLGHALVSSDPWFRPVDIQVGPDGALYVADFYEQRIDHASHYQGRVDHESGRIYRIRASRPAPAPARRDLADATMEELAELLGHPNKWTRQTALRLIGDRRDPSAAERFRALARRSVDQMALEALWACHLSGGLTSEAALEFLDHDDPHVRLWTVRLVCDARQVAPELARRMADVARHETSVEVRSQLACSARRLPARDALPIVRSLLEHSRDAEDPHQPLSLWWAIEDKCTSDPDAVVDWFSDAALWELPLARQHILSRVMRRFAQTGQRADLHHAARLLELSPARESTERLMAGFEEAYQGRSVVNLPESLVAAIAKAGGGSLALGLRQRQPDAVEKSLALIADESAESPERIQLVEVLATTRVDEAVPVLLDVARRTSSEPLRTAALGSLQAYPDAAIGQALVALQSGFSESNREVAHSVLASRPSWARQLLQAVDAGSVAPAGIATHVVRKLLLHSDAEVARLVEKHWGQLAGASTAEMQAKVAQFTRAVTSGSGNPYNGKKLYLENCGKCHRLFDDGGNIGPDLTAYKRDDLRTMLLNVVNPSIEIREGYEQFVVATDDGRTLNGFIADQDNQVVILKGVEGQSVIVPRSEIEDMAAVGRSVMPDGLLDKYSDQQVRDLFAYLRATQPLP